MAPKTAQGEKKPLKRSPNEVTEEKVSPEAKKQKAPGPPETSPRASSSSDSAEECRPKKEPRSEEEDSSMVVEELSGSFGVASDLGDEALGDATKDEPGEDSRRGASLQEEKEGSKEEAPGGLTEAETEEAESTAVPRHDVAQEVREGASGACRVESDPSPDVLRAGSAGVDDGPGSARRKPTQALKKTYDFKCKFNQTVAFKSFFENLGNILSEVTLEVRCSPEFSGIVADSISSDCVCLVQGKIAGQVEVMNVPVEQAIFCITVKDVLDIFHNIHPQHFVEIYRVQGSTDVVMHIYEPSLRASNFKYCIQTLDKEVDTIPLNDMTYSYYVEVELNAFKNALKTAKNQSVDCIQLLIYENAPSGLSKERSIYFVIKFKGVRTSVSFPYESKILSDASSTGPLHIKAMDKDASGPEDDACEEGVLLHDLLDSMQPAYQGTYQLKNLFSFVKSMERSVITLRLAKDQPLIMDYPLGCSSTDGIRFVTSATAADVD